MEKFGLSVSVSDVLQKNFKNINDYNELLPYIQNSPVSIIYGGTKSGKTYALKEIFKNATGSIIYIRSSPPRWTSENPLLKISNRHPDEKTFTNIDKLLKNRSKKIELGESPNMITLVFDDIQNLPKDLNYEMEKLLNLLAYSGRHYNIRTIILVQNYRGLPKGIRAQASSFMALLPISQTYREQIYRDYLKIFKSDRDLIEISRFPRHSLLFVYESRINMYKLAN